MKPRWQRWYPKSWRARYGEEYERLLEDLDAEHRLSGRDQLDVYRSGLVLHGSSPDGRRRIVVLAMALAIIGTGLGLGFGLGIGGSTANDTYVAPLLTATPVSPGRPAHLSLSVKGCPVNLDGELLGPSGVPVEDSYYWEAPALPPSRELSSGTLDGIAWNLFAPQPSSVRTSLLSRLDAGGLGLDGHWYSLCELFNDSWSLPGQFTGESTTWAPTITLVDIAGRAVAYGIFPTATEFRLYEAGGPTLHPTVIESGAGPFSIFLSVLPGNACQLGTVETSDVTLRSGWQGSETLMPSRCTPFRPLTSPELGGSPVSRNTGLVAAVGTNSIVLSTEGWPPLNVSIGVHTRVLLDGPNWKKGLLSEVKRCDYVYVAGTISPTTATASAVYVVGPGPLSCAP